MGVATGAVDLKGRVLILDKAGAFPYSPTHWFISHYFSYEPRQPHSLAMQGMQVIQLPHPAQSQAAGFSQAGAEKALREVPQAHSAHRKG
jgi:hypothetical protein